MEMWRRIIARTFLEALEQPRQRQAKETYRLSLVRSEYNPGHSGGLSFFDVTGQPDSMVYGQPLKIDIANKNRSS